MRGGAGWRAGTRGESQIRRAGTKYFWCGGGEGQLSSLSAQELTHSSLYNIITHKRWSPCQQFSASQDAHSISLALNDSCPWSHFHTGNNESRITFNGITVHLKVLIVILSKFYSVYNANSVLGRHQYCKYSIIWSQCWNILNKKCTIVFSIQTRIKCAFPGFIFFQISLKM